MFNGNRHLHQRLEIGNESNFVPTRVLLHAGLLMDGNYCDDDDHSWKNT